MADLNNQADRVDTCEVVVVGAGLVGAVVAASLADEGLDVAVLEAREVASGSTGRAAGLVLTGLPMPYVEAAEHYGRDTARALWALTVESRERLALVADRLDVSLGRTGSLLLATDAAEATILRASVEMLVEDGFEARFEAVDPLNRGFTAALRYPDDLVVDAAALTRRIFELYRIPVHTGTEVYGFRQDGDEVLVLAQGRVVRTTTVVLAVNAYAALLDGYFKEKIAPTTGYTLLTRPLATRLLVQAGSVGPFSYRQFADGRLRFTAWRPEYETPAGDARDNNIEVELMRFVGRYFPGVASHVAQRGSAVLGVSRDGLPLLGALPRMEQVFFAVGFGGYGLSMAFSAADLLTGLILRGAEPSIFSARRLE